MKQNSEPKAVLPNKIPVKLIDAVKEKASKEGLSCNEWLQKVLWEAVK